VVLAQGDRKALEFLAECHRHRVLQLRAANLHDVREFPAFVAKRLLEQFQLRQQPFDGETEADLERRGISVVGALAAIDVIVGVELLVAALRVAGQFLPAIGDHLVDVHVGRGAGPALHDVHHELIVQLPILDLLAGAVDQISLFLFEHPDLGVGARGGLLDTGVAEDQVRVGRDRPSADRKILERAADVDPPVSVGRNLPGTEAIGFDTGRTRGLLPGVDALSECGVGAMISHSQFGLLETGYRRCKFESTMSRGVSLLSFGRRLRRTLLLGLERREGRSPPIDSSRPVIGKARSFRGQIGGPIHGGFIRVDVCPLEVARCRSIIPEAAWSTRVPPAPSGNPPHAAVASAPDRRPHSVTDRRPREW
jgi:hypothetical protein